MSYINRRSIRRISNPRRIREEYDNRQLYVYDKETGEFVEYEPETEEMPVESFRRNRRLSRSRRLLEADGDIEINEINFPDDNFRRFIRNAISNGSDVLTREDISDVTELDVDSKRIYSLEGIEYFTNLKELYCEYNKLTSLDVSGCKNLEVLSCSTNNLTSLDVSGCTNLTELYCSSNKLTLLDVSDCKNLVRLYCSSNNLTLLDVSGYRNLEYLICERNNLTSLDVSGCKNLTLLTCYYNNLTSLDVSDCKNLKRNYLVCDNDVDVIE